MNHSLTASSKGFKKNKGVKERRKELNGWFSHLGPADRLVEVVQLRTENPESIEEEESG